jgi:hypothetical protein
MAPSARQATVAPSTLSGLAAVTRTIGAILKPFAIEAVLATVARLLGGRTPGRGAGLARSALSVR